MISLFRRNSTDTTAARTRALCDDRGSVSAARILPGMGHSRYAKWTFRGSGAACFWSCSGMRDDADCAFRQAFPKQAVFDVDRNLREMGVGDLSVGRQVKSLTEGLYGRLGVYAEGIERTTRLDAELRRNLFAEGGSLGHRSVQAAESYMRRETESLKTCDTAELLAGCVRFGAGPVQVLKMAENNGVEFSGRSRFDEIGRDGLRVKLTADSSERAALATRFDIIGVSVSKRELQLHQNPRRRYYRRSWNVRG